VKYASELIKSEPSWSKNRCIKPKYENVPLEESMIEMAIAELREGRMAILTTRMNREQEAVVIIPADWVTADALNFMISNARGILCHVLTAERAQWLDLPLMAGENQSSDSPAFTLSVDAQWTGSGISTRDRALTIQALADPATKPKDLRKPGHVFPLIAHPAGVLGKAGYAEAAIDLARLAGCSPNAVLCGILADDGTVANGSILKEFSVKHDIVMVELEEVREFRRSEKKIFEDL
jgi:3,4-dihydroxy 2-butanone 4-phosphate synthase/GTP cyclohydrolase II